MVACLTTIQQSFSDQEVAGSSPVGALPFAFLDGSESGRLFALGSCSSQGISLIFQGTDVHSNVRKGVVLALLVSTWKRQSSAERSDLPAVADLPVA